MMHIENVDCFRGWLIEAVYPICDANPQHLARYIIALVRKEKPMNELVNSCIDNLEIFLQERTKPFVSKMFEVIANKTYMAYPQVEDKELEKRCKVGDAARSTATSEPQSGTRISGENKFTVIPSGGSKAMSDIGEKIKPIQGEGKNSVRSTGSPLKSQTQRDDRNGTSTRRPENDLQGKGLDSNKLQSDDRLKSRREREGLHERLDKGSWKRPSSPQGLSASSSRPLNPQEVQKRHRSVEKGSSGVPNQVTAKRTSPVPPRNSDPERSQGSNQSSSRGRQLNEYQHENFRKSSSRGMQPIRSPVSWRAPRVKSRVDSHASSLDRASHVRKRSRSAARSNSRSPSARSDSSRSSLESFSSKCSASKRAHVEKEPDVNSRSSTPLDENADRNIDKFHTVVQHPRCRDYDEKGYCVRGDLCPFDHGSDPYVVDESQFSKVLPFQGGVSVGRTDGGVVQGQVRRPLVPSHPDASVLPNVSRPPPPFLLRPMPPPPPHFIASQGMPPPGYYPQSLPVRASCPDVYGPIPADAYLPEPYKPKAVGGYRATGVTPAVAAAGLVNSNDVWRATLDAHTSYQQQQQQRIISSQAPVARHANLVQVPTQEDLGSNERTRVNTFAKGNVGLKRKASELDRDTQPAYPAAETEFTVPPPVKRTALDHPGIRQNTSHANKTLEIRKIPRDQNTIANINNHFSKFGTIINLQVGWEGDPQAALVSFASNAQASAAYRSQEPFLNNRFIKIFWHNTEKQQQTETQQPNVSSQPTNEAHQLRPKRIILPQRHQLQLNNKLKKAMQSLPKLDVTAVQALNSEESQTPSKVANDSPAANLRPTHEVSLTKLHRKSSKDFTAKVALTKKIEEVTLQSQLLLTRYINEQKALFEKLEKDKATMSAEDRASVVQTIKKLAANIEQVKSTVSAVMKPTVVEPRPKVVHPTVPRGSLRKVNVRRFSGSGKLSPAVAASSSQLSLAQGSIFQDKQLAQKAILDTELELMTCHKEGQDADELRKRVMALKEEAASLGLFNSSGQGRGCTRGRGRGAHNVGRRWAVPRFRANTLTVDRRPKQLLVTGFQPEEKDELLAHITSFGAVASNSFDLTVPSLLVTFKSRLVAEKVAAEGCTFKNKKLTMVWKKSVLSELNTCTEQENTGVAVKPVVHADLKTNATGENVPSKKNTGHSIVPGSELREEGRVAEETDLKFVCSAGLQNQDAAITAEDDNSELLGLDEEDDDDDEEERSWRR